MYTVVIEVDNSSRKLLPGMTASVTIKIDEANDVPVLPAMVLQYKPSAALRKTIVEKVEVDPSKGEEIVYQFEKGHLVPRVIVKGLTDMANMEIKSGLDVGDMVILEVNAGNRHKK